MLLRYLKIHFVALSVSLVILGGPAAESYAPGDYAPGGPAPRGHTARGHAPSRGRIYQPSLGVVARIVPIWLDRLIGQQVVQSVASQFAPYDDPRVQQYV